MNKQIKVLRVFDLDETFFRMPGYTSKKSVETEELNFSHPYDFYDHPASLCEEAHNIQLISPVYEAWKKSTVDSESATALITHRVEELRETVFKILERREISFDESFFLGRKTSKADTLIELINRYPYLDEVHIYEDSIQQLGIYQRLESTLKLASNRIYPTFHMYIVDKSKMYKIKNIDISEETRIELI